MIRIDNLRKVYRVGTEKVVALNRIDLTIEKGEIVCILGTSGSGKSTLLNMMAGLEKPTKGTILVDGEDITKMNEKKLALFRREKVGFIFQSYNLLNAFTALENVTLPLIFKGVGEAARLKEGARILRRVGLGDHLMHKPTQMSGGQQQRVGIARAYANRPAIVFADEPTGNLDSQTSEEVLDLMLEMAKRDGQTLILVTHDPEVARYADKIVYILDGDIQKIEMKEEEVRRYVHP